MIYLLGIIHILFLLTRPSRDVTKIWIRNARAKGISTHTPLAGRDLLFFFKLSYFLEFLLTRPSRDVTYCINQQGRTARISTHTPLAGRD